MGFYLHLMWVRAVDAHAAPVIAHVFKSNSVGWLRMAAHDHLTRFLTFIQLHAALGLRHASATTQTALLSEI